MRFQKIKYETDRWFNLKNLFNEIWKDIKGYEGLYQISNYGRVKSFPNQKRKSIRILHFRKNGLYFQITLCKNSNQQAVFVHRLVAEAFIPNPNNFPIVNHLDGNPSNNKINNLEWCTQQQNMHHATINGLISSHKWNKLDKDELYTLYVDKKMSPNDISNYYNKKLSKSAVYRALKIYNIPTRSPYMAAYFRKNSKIKVLDKIDFKKELESKTIKQFAKENNINYDYLCHYLNSKNIYIKGKYKRNGNSN